MAAEEFAKLFYAMNSILEHATKTLDVSKKAAIVLWLLAESNDGCLKNNALVMRFGNWNTNRTRASASRDVTLANAELDEKKWITMHVSPKRVEISSEGRVAFEKLRASLSGTLNDQRTPEEQRRIIKELILELPGKKPMDRERRFADEATVAEE